MKNRSTSLLFFSLTVLLTACHWVLKMEMVNHSGQNLVIESLDTKLIGTTYSVADGQSVRIKIPYKLRIKHKDGTWDYDLPAIPVPQEYRKRVGVNAYLEKYQIERDGVIYVLLPESKAPTAKLPPQPPGNPVRPR